MTYIENLSKEKDFRNNLMEAQNRYTLYLEKSKYNRKVSDFRNGNYKSVGKYINYTLNTLTSKVKYNYGYNFNHTLCPFYMNYQNKLNVLKIKNITSEYQRSYKFNEKTFFVTLTFPNLIADVNIEEDNSLLVKKANQTITNLYKQLKKKFAATGMIKKYEVTYKYEKNVAKANSHFHLVVSFKNRKNTRWKKSTTSNISVNEFIFDYWYKNFVSKMFDNMIKNESRAAYDFQEVNYDNLANEVAGYISKGSKRDYLISQEIFDYAYVHMHNKRIITYLGIYKDINKELKLDMVDEIEELESNEDDNKEYDYSVHFYYHFKEQQYKIYKVVKKWPTAGLDNSTSSGKNIEKEILDHFKNLENKHVNSSDDNENELKSQMNLFQNEINQDDL